MILVWSDIFVGIYSITYLPDYYNIYKVLQCFNYIILKVNMELVLNNYII